MGIVQGGICPRWELADGLLFKGQLSGGEFPRWGLSGGQFSRGVNVLGGNCPGEQLSGGIVHGELS